MTVARAQHPRLQWHACTPSMPFDRVHGGGRARGRARIPKPYSAEVHNRTYNVHVASASERLACVVGPYFRGPPSAASDLRPAMYVPSSHLVISVPAIVPSVCLHRTMHGSQQSSTAANKTDQCNKTRSAYGLWCVRCRRRAIREGSGRSQAVAAPSASKRRRKRGRS